MDKETAKEHIKKIIKKYENNNINYLNMYSEIAKLRDGKIKKGTIYINSTTPICFIDKHGNEFTILPSNLRAGSWSPYENNKIHNSEYYMNELQKIALSKGGKIKDGEKYINNTTKMTFIDQLGNEFKMSPKVAKRGQWSPFEGCKVYDTNFHMAELQKIVLSKGGKIKDGEQYISSSTKMTFIDRLGNDFKMIPSAVKSGKWSPYESQNVRDADYHMKELQEIALSRGGKIKEGEKYINNITKMTFIDQLGNEFKMNAKSVKRGRWSALEKNCCEHICRQIVEQVYGYKFPSVWDIVKRKNGNKLQLDGYSQELNVAFEYQGIQHTTGWKNDTDSLLKITKRDEEKKQECIKKKILLLIINYYSEIKNIQQVIEQTITDIKSSYQSNNIEIPLFIQNLNIKEIKLDLSKISHIVLMQKEIEEIVLSKGGKIKEGETYIHSKTKMTFIDKLGNEFKMSPNHVKKGHWSPYEAGRVINNPTYHLNILKNIASSKGGKIKDGEIYVNSNTKIICIDKLGNEFKIRPYDLKSGNWPKKHTFNN